MNDRFRTNKSPLVFQRVRHIITTAALREGIAWLEEGITRDCCCQTHLQLMYRPQTAAIPAILASLSSSSRVDVRSIVCRCLVLSKNNARFSRFCRFNFVASRLALHLLPSAMEGAIVFSCELSPAFR